MHVQVKAWLINTHPSLVGALVGVDSEQPELPVVEQSELLSMDEDQTPHESYQPSVNGVIASVSSHQDLRHCWQQPLE